MYSRQRSNKPKPIPDEKALYEIAVRALARKARSTGELRQLLGRRKPEASDVEAVIARLRENGYLDDARYARAFASSRIENERQGARRVQRDLAARRVHPELIEKTIGTAYKDVDERELLREHLRRKVRLTKPPTKASAVASLYQRLLRAGFSSATIVKELQGLMQAMRQAMPKDRSRRNSSRGASRGGSSDTSREKGAAIDPEKWQEWVESLSDLPELTEEE